MVRLQTGPRPVDDLTLKDRVESEIFRSPDLPKGQINFDVESAVVTVRGQVDNALQIAKIEKAVLKVPGVRGVEVQDAGAGGGGYYCGDECGDAGGGRGDHSGTGGA